MCTWEVFRMKAQTEVVGNCRYLPFRERTSGLGSINIKASMGK